MFGEMFGSQTNLMNNQNMSPFQQSWKKLQLESRLRV